MGADISQTAYVTTALTMADFYRDISINFSAYQKTDEELDQIVKEMNDWKQTNYDNVLNTKPKLTKEKLRQKCDDKNFKVIVLGADQHQPSVLIPKSYMKEIAKNGCNVGKYYIKQEKTATIPFSEIGSNASDANDVVCYSYTLNMNAPETSNFAIYAFMMMSKDPQKYGFNEAAWKVYKEIGLKIAVVHADVRDYSFVVPADKYDKRIYGLYWDYIPNSHNPK